MSYNLDQDAGDKETFTFTLGGHEYIFTYPTTEEVQEIFNTKLPNGQPDMENLMNRIYGYIRPAETEGTPSIEDALKAAKIPVNKAFQDMVLKEFGLKE